MNLGDDFTNIVGMQTVLSLSLSLSLISVRLSANYGLVSRAINHFGTVSVLLPAIQYLISHHEFHESLSVITIRI